MPNADDPIDAETAALIRRKAAQIVRRARLPRSDLDDVAQELSIELLPRLPKFDRAKAEWGAFVRMLLARAAASFLRSPAARPGAASLSQEAVGPLPAASGGERAEVDEVLATLSPELRRVAELVGTHTRTEMARVLRISRSTVYRRTLAVRAAFERAGFEESPGIRRTLSARAG